jgi:mannan endo-1,4-beta-mannosidase
MASKSNFFKSILFIPVFLLLSCSVYHKDGQSEKVSTIQPVNPNASDEAKEVLNFLHRIKGEKIVSGIHNELWSNEWTDQIIEITGQRPGLWGSDYRFGEFVQHRQKMTDEAIRQWKEEKVLITIMYHATRPMDPIDGIWRDRETNEGVQGSLTDEEWEQLVTPGTEIHTQWLYHIDTVAEFLKQIRDAGVPVLWRPYHEMNGGWFWWGKKQGENGYVKLWKMMFDRYVNHHELNNLIWVWNPNAPRENVDDYHLYYPGHDYVDVLATDIYSKDYKQSHHDDLLEIAEGRPIALGETGPMISIDSLMKVQPQYVWFMGWRDLFNDQEPDHLRSLFNHPRVLNAPLEIKE